MQVNVTVTLLVFQPAALGRGNAEPVIWGGVTTVKERALLVVPPALVMVRLPVVAPAGTCAVIPLEFQLGVNGAFTPLKLTDPTLLPKLEPPMKIKLPIVAESGERKLIAGCTVKGNPLLKTPPAAVTTIFPLLAPPGTVTVILLSLHEPMVAVNVPNLTLRLLVFGPKFVPEMVTEPPAALLVGETALMAGGGTTVKDAGEVLVRPAAVVKIKLPDEAPDGRVTETVFVRHELTVSGCPFNVTPPLPCDDPNPEPWTRTTEPTGPLAGVKGLKIVGKTVKLMPLLCIPATVTTTLPLVAAEGTFAEMLESLQEFTVAVTPLNFTVLLPCVEPKFDPEIATGRAEPEPATWLVGFSEVIVWQTLRVVPRSRKARTREANAKRKDISGDLDLPDP